MAKARKKPSDALRSDKVPRPIPSKQRCSWPGSDTGGYFVSVEGDNAIVQAPIHDGSRLLEIRRVPLDKLTLYSE